MQNSNRHDCAILLVGMILLLGSRRYRSPAKTARELMHLTSAAPPATERRSLSLCRRRRTAFRPWMQTASGPWPSYIQFAGGVEAAALQAETSGHGVTERWRVVRERCALADVRHQIPGGATVPQRSRVASGGTAYCVLCHPATTAAVVCWGQPRDEVRCSDAGTMQAAEHRPVKSRRPGRRTLAISMASTVPQPSCKTVRDASCTMHKARAKTTTKLCGTFQLSEQIQNFCLRGIVLVVRCSV